MQKQWERFRTAATALGGVTPLYLPVEKPEDLVEAAEIAYAQAQANHTGTEEICKISVRKKREATSLFYQVGSACLIGIFEKGGNRVHTWARFNKPNPSDLKRTADIVIRAESLIN